MNPSIFYVKDYLKNAKSDSDAVAQCLSAAREFPSRTILFDGKNWLLSEAILLPSETEVVIKNCRLQQADGTFDNLFRGENVQIDPENPYGLPLACFKLSNIKITGIGNACISGPNKKKIGYHPVLKEDQEMVGDFWGWRTHMISLSNCTGFEISGLSITQTNGWAISFDLCSHGHLHDLTFHTQVKNGDGIDFRSGCHHCLVERITGTTSDDTVACTALFSGARLYPFKNYLYPSEPSNCLEKSTPEKRNIWDITIRDIATCGKHHGIICLAANGNQVYNIWIENFDEPNDQWREATVKIYTGYGDGYTDGDLHDIQIKNIHASYAEHAFFCNTRVKNVFLENITHPNPEKRFQLDFPEGIMIKDSGNPFHL